MEGYQKMMAEENRKTTLYMRTLIKWIGCPLVYNLFTTLLNGTPVDVTSLHHVIDYVTNDCRTHVSLKTKRFLVQNYFCQL